MNGKNKLRPGTRLLIATGALAVFAAFTSGCGDDDDHGPILSPAQQSGVGAACRVGMDTDCSQQVAPLVCLDFKGGYCGLSACTRLEDCPLGSACVAHEDGNSYCFLICTDKVQCNPTRPVDAQSNCVSNISFVGGANNGNQKACVPPS